MFSFFINGVFFDFWGNKAGDIFYDNTVSKMNWYSSLVSLYHYPSIPASRPEFFDFDESKNLLIQEKVITEVLVGPEGEQVLEEQISYNTKETILAEVFAINGEKFKIC